MRCFVCGRDGHEATTAGCPYHEATSFDHTRTYAPLGYAAGRLAALREVREMVLLERRHVWSASEYPTLAAILAGIDAMIKREEEGR